MELLSPRKQALQCTKADANIVKGGSESSPGRQMNLAVRSMCQWLWRHGIFKSCGFSSGVQKAINVRQHVSGGPPHEGLERTGGSCVLFVRERSLV